MTSLQRGFKFLCLLEMILGLLVVIYVPLGLVHTAGSVFAVVGLACFGVLAFGFGVFGARAANVPATVGSTRILFVVLALLGIALGAAAALVPDFGNVAVVACTVAVPTLVALIALVQVNKVLKEVDR